jgi:very-short-patch-repair endonuclease
MGYTVIRFWGNEIKQSVEKCANSVEQLLNHKFTMNEKKIIKEKTQ